MRKEFSFSATRGFFAALRMTALFVVLFSTVSFAANKTTTGSGNWSAASTWSPSGVPTSIDNITIASGHTITIDNNSTAHSITVNANGTLTWKSASLLTITGNLSVTGTVTMKGGDITLTTTGSTFTLGNNSSFTWEPGNNTVSGASLFTKGTESFNPTSTLIIKKWYDYTVGLGTVVTGSFGNLEVNTVSYGKIMEWNQNNEFEKHLILGKLTIDQGWVTLDKSGKISNTTIGSIYLKNVNASFYAHNGNHPSAFTFKTGSVNNNGGNFIGLSDGNGNVTVQVTGNFTNIGNVKIINNTGVSGVANGNATFIVDSTYSQNTGDTRIIYNVSTTTSGLYTATIRNLTLNGGIFMGQTGCRTTGGICSLSVLGDFNINFTDYNDKFRGTSLTSIGSNINNVEMNLSVGGNFTVNGISASEVTSAASSGKENITITGNISVQGSSVSFNYGASAGAHSAIINITGNAFISGGTTYLSRNNGPAAITVGKNLEVSQGTLIVKGADSTATLNVMGSFLLKSGTVYMHNNGNIASTTSSSITVNGDYNQSGGVFSYDFNPSSSSAPHALNIAGPNYIITGGTISTASTTVFGKINFNRSGQTNFKRPSTSTHSITLAKYIFSSGASVMIADGEMTINNAIAMELNGGVLALNGTTLTMDNGSTDAFGRSGGYVSAELNAAGKSGRILWKNLTAEAHEFPFGAKDSYLPVTIIPNGNATVGISTYATSQDNTPFPASDINFNYYERGSPNYTTTTIIDRWWTFDVSSDVSADVILSYSAAENTLHPNFRSSYLNVLQWAGGGWNVVSKAMAATSGTGTINISDNAFNKSGANASMCVGHEESGDYIPITELKAKIIGDVVSISWFSRQTDGTFTIERSTDGKNFTPLKEIPALGNTGSSQTTLQTSLSYSQVDETPVEGTSYYRIKYVGANGKITYSTVQTVVNESAVMPGITVKEFGPNPFSENFWINYQINTEDNVKIIMTNGSGQIIHNEETFQSEGTHRFDYTKGSELQKGIYFVTIESNGKTVIQKLLKN